MPVSLRLPTEIEAQIAAYSAREGLSKSAVIVRSIQEFFARNAQPSALEIYEAVMRSESDLSDDNTLSQADALPPHKSMYQAKVRQKHAERSALAIRHAKPGRAQ